MSSFWNPFVKTAGLKALLWGVAGLVISAACASFSGWHAHGLLHYGAAPVDEWWVFGAEYLVIWLVPATVFYALGAAMSRSRVRAIDVYGTTAFALLPFVVMNLLYLSPAMERFLALTSGEILDLAAIMEVVSQPAVILFLLATLMSMAVMVVWLFGAVKVSCNLKGGRLWVVYLSGVVGGDIVCRVVISLLY